MDVQLQRLRKRAGYKTQGEFAQKLGVPERRYASWERGEVTMSLEQAYLCAVALDCTIDEIAGLKRPAGAGDQRVALDGYFDAMNETGRAVLVESARLMSGSPEARATL